MSRSRPAINENRWRIARSDLRSDSMTHLYLSPDNDSLYLDVMAGDRSPVGMTEVADGVLLHVDDAGALVAIEVLDLSRRGGFRMDDLDAGAGEPKEPVFEEIERIANGGAPADRDPDQ
jgi:hypothetical protein